VPDALAPELTLALQAFAADYPKLKISLQSVPDSAAAIKSGADLTVVLRYPGTAAPDHSTVVLRHPIAIMLPLTLSPNDLSVGQVVDLLTGGVADWEQVGGTKRPIRLALSDPAQLAAVGALAGRPDARPLVTARVDAAQVLLAETDAGLDEAAVVPWTGARLKSKALRIDGKFPDDANYVLSTDLMLVPLRKEGQTLADQAGPGSLGEGVAGGDPCGRVARSKRLGRPDDEQQGDGARRARADPGSSRGRAHRPR